MINKTNIQFCDLYDIIGGPNSTEEERWEAWKKLLLIEDISGFSVLIAAKYSWREFSKEYKEKAWQELLKRGIKNNLNHLHYLTINAPEPWCKKANKLKEKLEKKLLAKNQK
jgi:hypothetical protein